MTVSVTVALSVRPPPVPITVIVDVPSAAGEATAIVMVELPVPGAAIGFGLKLTVTPLGWPEADNVTAELKPFKLVVVMVEVPECLRATLRAVGETLMLKSAAVVTVNDTVVVCVTPPPVPVTVIV